MHPARNKQYSRSAIRWYQQNGELSERIEEIEQRANSTLMQVEDSKSLIDLKLASMEEMIAEMSSNNERTRVEFMGNKSIMEGETMMSILFHLRIGMSL